MRHHGVIQEDRRGLAIVVGLLAGIIFGAVLLAPGAEEGPRTAGEVPRGASAVTAR